jgi:uncharacterized coiled-coil DUF342 family protein
MKKLRNFILIMGGIIGFLFALFSLRSTGGKRVKNAIGKMEKAEKLKEKADVIDVKVRELREKGKTINKDTREKIKEIRKMDDLREISDAFNKL